MRLTAVFTGTVGASVSTSVEAEAILSMFAKVKASVNGTVSTSVSVSLSNETSFAVPAKHYGNAVYGRYRVVVAGTSRKQAATTCAITDKRVTYIRERHEPTGGMVLVDQHSLTGLAPRRMQRRLTVRAAPEPPVGSSTQAQDPNALAPQLKPDAKTLFLSRGTVPNNTVSQVEVRAAATLTMTVVCSGNGQLTIRFSGSTVEPIICPSAGQVVELGAVSKGTSEFEFAGDDGLTYVARVQSDRPVG